MSLDHMCHYRACCRGDVEICQLLVNNGASVVIDNTSGLSPLHVACLYGHSDCVAALLTVINFSSSLISQSISHSFVHSINWSVVQLMNHLSISLVSRSVCYHFSSLISFYVQKQLLL